MLCQITSNKKREFGNFPCLGMLLISRQAAANITLTPQMPVAWCYWKAEPACEGWRVVEARVAARWKVAYAGGGWDEGSLCTQQCFWLDRRQSFGGLGHNCRAVMFPYVCACRQAYTHSAPCLSSGHSPSPDVWLQESGCTQMLCIACCCLGRDGILERQEVMHRKQHSAEQSWSAHSWDSCRASPNLQLRAYLVRGLLVCGTLGHCTLRSNSYHSQLQESSPGQLQGRRQAEQILFSLVLVVFILKLITISAALLGVPMEQV